MKDDYMSSEMNRYCKFDEFRSAIGLPCDYLDVVQAALEI